MKDSFQCFRRQGFAGGARQRGLAGFNPQRRLRTWLRRGGLFGFAVGGARQAGVEKGADGLVDEDGGSAAAAQRRQSGRQRRGQRRSAGQQARAGLP